MTTITPVEAAERAGVNVETIRRWIRTGLLSAERTKTGRYRIHPEHLDEALGRERE